MTAQQGDSEVKIPTFMVPKEPLNQSTMTLQQTEQNILCLLTINICTVSWNQTRRKRNPERLSDLTLFFQLGDCEAHKMDSMFIVDKFVHLLNIPLLNTYYLLGTALGAREMKGEPTPCSQSS